MLAYQKPSCLLQEISHTASRLAALGANNDDIKPVISDAQMAYHNGGYGSPISAMSSSMAALGNPLAPKPASNNPINYHNGGYSSPLAAIGSPLAALSNPIAAISKATNAAFINSYINNSLLHPATSQSPNLNHASSSPTNLRPSSSPPPSLQSALNSTNMAATRQHLAGLFGSSTSNSSCQGTPVLEDSQVARLAQVASELVTALPNFLPKRDSFSTNKKKMTSELEVRHDIISGLCKILST